MRLMDTHKIAGKSIVFDWGNTLVFDPFDDIKDTVAKKGLDYSRQTYGVEFDLEKFIADWSTSNENLSFQFAAHFMQEEPFIQWGLKAVGVADEIRAFLGLKILEIYREEFRNLLVNSPRKEILRKVLVGIKNKGMQTAIISNDRTFSARASFAWMGIESLIDHYLPAETIGFEKPDPVVISVAAEFFGHANEDIIYVGDDPIRDIGCAHKAGAKAILSLPPEKYRTSNVWRDYKNHPDQPDATIENLEDLLEVIA